MAIDWNQWRVRVNSGGRVRCEAGWRLDESFAARLHDFDLWFVWAGRGRMRLRGGRTFELRPGMALWMRPGGVYLAEQDLDHRLGVNYVHFDLLGADGQPNCRVRGVPGEVHHVADAAYVDALMRRVVTALRDRPPRGVDALAQRRITAILMTALLMDIATAATQTRRPATAAARRHDAVVTELAGQIRESPADAPTVLELAQRTGYSPDHLARIFRRTLGVSPQQFIVQARIDRAKLLLRETSMTITQIADALGYTDVFHFSRQFTQKAGATPTAYRLQQ